MHSGSLMKYKILGAVLVLTGLYLIAKLKLHLWGLFSSVCGFLFGDEKRYETKIAAPNSGLSRDILDCHSISRKAI